MYISAYGLKMTLNNPVNLGLEAWCPAIGIQDRLDELIETCQNNPKQSKMIQTARIAGGHKLYATVIFLFTATPSVQDVTSTCFPGSHAAVVHLLSPALHQLLETLGKFRGCFVGLGYAIHPNQPVNTTHTNLMAHVYVGVCIVCTKYIYECIQTWKYVSYVHKYIYTYIMYMRIIYIYIYIYMLYIYWFEKKKNCSIYVWLCVRARVCNIYIYMCVCVQYKNAKYCNSKYKHIHTYIYNINQ